MKGNSIFMAIIRNVIFVLCGPQARIQSPNIIVYVYCILFFNRLLSNIFGTPNRAFESCQCWQSWCFTPALMSCCFLVRFFTHCIALSLICQLQANKSYLTEWEDVSLTFPLRSTPRISIQSHIYHQMSPSFTFKISKIPNTSYNICVYI